MKRKVNQPLKKLKGVPLRKCYRRGNICYIPLNDDRLAFTDRINYDKVKDCTWFISSDGYVKTKLSGRTYPLHKYLCPSTGIIDHANGNTLDNRSINLRPATQSQNNANNFQCRNKHGYKGVCWVPSRKKWVATVGKKWAGTASTVEQAARLYDKKALEMFGEFASLNFPEVPECK